MQVMHVQISCIIVTPVQGLHHIYYGYRKLKLLEHKLLTKDAVYSDSFFTFICSKEISSLCLTFPKQVFTELT